MYLRGAHEAEDHVEKSREHIAARLAAPRVGILQRAIGADETAVLMLLHVVGDERRAEPQAAAEHHPDDRRGGALEKGLGAALRKPLPARALARGAVLVEERALAPKGLLRKLARTGLRLGSK